MAQSAGAHEEILAEIVDEKTGIVKVKYGTGQVEIRCDRHGPCKWVAVEKVLNNKSIQTEKLHLVDNYIGALEEAYQVWKYGGDNGAGDPATPV